MHRKYVGPTSARCRQTPADIPPSSRYRPDVGMFAGMQYAKGQLVRKYPITCISYADIVFYFKNDN